MNKKRAIIKTSSCGIVLLDKSNVAIIDREDIERAMGHNWYEDSNGYAAYHTGKDGMVYLHRLIMGFPPKGMEVDHINHNRLDNTKENLRVCSHRQNLTNQRKQKNSRSKYKGLSWSERDEKWYARLNDKHLGSFQTQEQAAEVYNKAAKKLYGEFAFLNEIVYSKQFTEITK